MALSGKNLATSVVNKLLEGKTEEEKKAVRETMEASWDQIGEALVTYITNNAVVTIPAGVKVTQDSSGNWKTAEAGIGSIS